MNTKNIISLISSIRRKANELIAAELRSYGIKSISASHGFILHTLYRRDGILMKDIALNINKTPNTVTVLIKKLKSNGYVRAIHDSADNRATRIFLTPKGKSFEHIFVSISAKLIANTYKDFSTDERAQIIKLLSKMSNNL